MLIVCPSCATSYNIDVASLQPNGRQVRCVRCRKVWHAELGRADKSLVGAGATSSPHHAAQDAIRPFAEESVPPPPTERRAAAADHPAAQASTDKSLEPPDSSLAAAPENEGSAEAPIHPVDVEAPPIAPVDPAVGQSPIEADSDKRPEDIETYAARRLQRGARRKSLRWPLSPLQNVIAALLIVDAVLVAWRVDVVRILPQTASFYAMMGLAVNLRGLDFDSVSTTTEEHEGVPILVVGGNIVNITNKLVDVPRIKFAARNAAHDEIYSWTAAPPRATLAAGEAVTFRTRFASPPPDVRDVLVRFVTRNDILAGTH